MLKVRFQVLHLKRITSTSLIRTKYARETSILLILRDKRNLKFSFALPSWLLKVPIVLITTEDLYDNHIDLTLIVEVLFVCHCFFQLTLCYFNVLMNFIISFMIFNSTINVIRYISYIMGPMPVQVVI